jgi:hypothetical protein
MPRETKIEQLDESVDRVCTLRNLNLSTDQLKLIVELTQAIEIYFRGDQDDWIDFETVSIPQQLSRQQFCSFMNSKLPFLQLPQSLLELRVYLRDQKVITTRDLDRLDHAVSMEEKASEIGRIWKKAKLSVPILRQERSLLLAKSQKAQQQASERRKSNLITSLTLGLLTLYVATYGSEGESQTLKKRQEEQEPPRHYETKQRETYTEKETRKEVLEGWQRITLETVDDTLDFAEFKLTRKEKSPINLHTKDILLTNEEYTAWMRYKGQAKQEEEKQRTHYEVTCQRRSKPIDVELQYPRIKGEKLLDVPQEISSHLPVIMWRQVRLETGKHPQWEDIARAIIKRDWKVKQANGYEVDLSDTKLSTIQRRKHVFELFKESYYSAGRESKSFTQSTMFTTEFRNYLVNLYRGSWAAYADVMFNSQNVKANMNHDPAYFFQLSFVGEIMSLLAEDRDFVKSHMSVEEVWVLSTLEWVEHKELTYPQLSPLLCEMYSGYI